MFSTDKIDSPANLGPDQNHPSTEHANIRGHIDLTIGDFLNLAILAIDPLHQSVHPNANKAMLGQQLHQHILILNRNVLLQS